MSCFFGVRYWLASILVLCVVSLGTSQEAATWTDSSGKFKIQASFVRMEGNQVVLKKSDGSEVKVPLSKLSSASQQLAKGASASSKPLKPNASSNAASSKLNADATIEQFLDHMKAMTEAKDYSFVWDSLPASYQSDIESIVRQVGKELDPATHKALVDTKKQIIYLLQQKKQFVLNTHVLPMLNDPKVGDAYDPVVTALDTVLAIDMFSPDALQKQEIKVLATNYLLKAGPALDKLKSQLEALGMAPAESGMTNVNSMNYKVKSIDSNKAEVTFSVEGQPDQTEVFVKVEGRWVPEKIASNWKKNIAEMKKHLAENFSRSKQQEFETGIKQFNANVLEPLAKVQTQEEFDQFIQPLGMLAMMFTGGGMPLNGGQEMPPFGPGAEPFAPGEPPAFGE